MRRFESIASSLLVFAIIVGVVVGLRVQARELGAQTSRLNKFLEEQQQQQKDSDQQTRDLLNQVYANLLRPASTSVVRPRPGVIVVTRTRTVVVPKIICRLPSGKPCPRH